MIYKIVQSIRKGSFIRSVMRRLRITYRINNRIVYSEYIRENLYRKLKRKYRKEILNGANVSLQQKRGNTVWIFWMQGIENAPEIVKICVSSVSNAARNSGYNVVILSENNISQYVQLPEYINNKYNKGIISVAHFSDVLRTTLLCQYGGGWIDATVLCTAKKLPEYVYGSELFLYRDINWSDLDSQFSVISNWLIFSNSNHPILLLTQKLLYTYWKNEHKVKDYFIYHMFFTMATERYPEAWKHVPVYSNEPPRILQFELDEVFTEQRWEQIIQMTDIHKLAWKSKSNKKNTMYDYVVKTLK